MNPSGKDDERLLTPEELSTVRTSTLFARTAPSAHLFKLWRLAGRQLFNTVQGRFGFTLRGVRAGDQVVVLDGSPTPHVIRRVEERDGGERYRFVGDAYVHGLMYGEARDVDGESSEMVFV